MTPRWRIAWTVLFAILLAIFYARSVDASLNDRWPTDTAGVLHDGQIDALATQIMGREFAVWCVPDPHDNASGRTNFYEESFDDGETWYLMPVNEVELNGDQCGWLDKLINYRPGFFKHDEVTVLSIKPIPKKRSAQSVVWASDHTWQAANALLSFRHELEHALRVPEPQLIPPDGYLPALDEAIVECSAVRNAWPLIAGFHLPRWLNKNLLWSVKDVWRSDPTEYRQPGCLTR